MPYKLAILTTEHTKAQLETILDRLDCDCTFQFFLYRPFENIVTLYQSIPGNISGVLTSGKRFRDTIRHHLPNDPRIIVPLGIDDSALHRLFWRLLRENPGMDLSRVYVDFLDTLHLDIDTFLTKDTGVSLTTSMDSGDISSAAAFQIQEERQYQKLLAIWETGQFDLIITRFSGLLPLLRAKGVRAYYPAPSTENLRKTVETAIHEIELRQLQENQAAEIHINIWLPNQAAYTTDQIFEQRCLQLQQALETFLGDFTISLSIRRSHFGLNVLTDRKMVNWCTQNYTVCRLSDFLEKHLDFKVYVGYGIGKGIYQARLNAINAARESEVSGGTYLVNDKEELVGPLGRSTQLTVPTAQSGFAFEISQVGLSPLTVSKVLAALHSMPEERITARELALKLSVTQRSANHFLSAMETAGILAVVTTRRLTTRGRPERVYGLVQQGSQWQKKEILPCIKKTN